MAKKYFTKALSLGLALVLCLSLLPMAAFADGGVDEGMTPTIYDEVIQAAGDAVDAAEKAAEAAQKAADEAANKLIDAATDKATEKVGQQTGIVDAANGVIDSAAKAAEEHANTAAEAKGTVESASSTMEAKEAALLIAQDAAQRAADAAKQAQNAWNTANQAVEAAKKAVEEAEAEYQRILDGHDDRDGISDTEFKAKLAAAQEKLAAAQADLNGKDDANKTAAENAQTAQKAAQEAQAAYNDAKNASEFNDERIENVADNQSKLGEGDKTLAEQTQAVKDKKQELDNQPDTTEAEQAVRDANWDVTKQDSVVKNLNLEITNWKKEIKTIPNYNGGYQQSLGESSREMFMGIVSAYEANGEITTLGHMTWSAGYQGKSDISYDDFIQILRDVIGEKPDAYNKLPEAEAELERRKGVATKKEEAFNTLKGQIQEAQTAYDDAVKELLKAMGAEEGDYGQGQHDKLVNDAEKLNEAIGALNDLNAKTQAQEAAEKAAAAADKAFQDASDAMTEANRVLNIAKDALDNASPECSLKTLEELKADLAVKQAAFNKVKAEFDEKEAIKNQANANAEKAAKDAEDAQNALNRIIAGLAGGSTGTGVTIDDQAIPLASGPVTCAQFIDYLWRHEGSPAVAVNELFADHEFAPAITWALSYELIDETFEPDELVTVADVRAILGAFAGVFGTNAAAVSGLTTLSGDEGEAVLNCDEVLAEFFGEEYVPAEDSDIEIAA